MKSGQAGVWQPAYVALGSNLGDPVGHLLSAFEELAGISSTRLITRSALYRSRPMGPSDQPDFINAVCGMLTKLEVRALLAELQAIERVHGRDRQSGGRWGPRTLDLDLLTYGALRIAEEGLSLPHPGVAERNFVLLPLAAIAPDLEIAGLGRVASLAKRIGSDGLTRLDEGSLSS